MPYASYNVQKVNLLDFPLFKYTYCIFPLLFWLAHCSLVQSPPLLMWLHPWPTSKADGKYPSLCRRIQGPIPNSLILRPVHSPEPLPPPKKNQLCWSQTPSQAHEHQMQPPMQPILWHYSLVDTAIGKIDFSISFWRNVQNKKSKTKYLLRVWPGG